MIGLKLLWTGLAIIVALDRLLVVPAGQLVGAVLMLIGIILYWLDK